MASDRPRLYLIDGYALIYRAFFAMISRPLRTSKGENTSAAWGVVNFILRLREKYEPSYIAWINDAGDSFRTEVYADYKSTREKLDEELQADFDRSLVRINEMLRAFRIPVITVDGYEADDVIGTIAEQAAGQGMDAVIVSGDKDFYQLISPHVMLLNPGRGGPAGVDEQWVDETNASERLGVAPGQVVDYLALVGDSSDNVPGVKGIGAKGAAAILAEYGDLETAIAKAGEIKGKRAREALQSQADQARLSKQLVTIRRDVPFEPDFEAFREEEPDRDALSRVLAELEFYSLASRLGLTADGAEGAGETAEETSGPSVTVISDPSELPALVERLRAAPLVALSTQTDGGEPRGSTLIGLSLAASQDEAWYLPFGHRKPVALLDEQVEIQNLPPLADPVCAQLAAVLADPDVPKAGHDIKRDWQVLRHAGVELAGVAWDSMLASFVLDPGRRSHAIETLCLEHLGRAMRSRVDLVGRGRSTIQWSEVAVGEAAPWCGSGAATVLALHKLFTPPVESQALAPLLETVELPLIEVLTDMEWSGIRIDTVLFARLSKEMGEDLAEIESRIVAAAGGEFNLNSPRQLATLLFDQLQLPVLKKTRTGPSTDADVLDQLAAMGHEIPALILQYRELQKLRSTYVDVLPGSINPETGRIHTVFNQTGAATGRLSSSDPNLQNIPVRTPRGEAIRLGFIPEEEWRFVVADYSQIELRLIAHLSGDAAFIEAFRRGGDIHRQTASVIFGVEVDDVTSEMRGRAKTINFATIYGQGPFALARQLGISQEEARAFIARYFERFSGVRSYLDRMVDQARRQGYVETIFGRRRYIPEIKDKNFNIRAFGERTATNSPVQGSAADLIKIAMRRIHDGLRSGGFQGRMLLQVHDELVFEAPVSETESLSILVKDHMQHAVELDVPLVVDIGVGENWLDAKH